MFKYVSVGRAAVSAARSASANHILVTAGHDRCQRAADILKLLSRQFTVMTVIAQQSNSYGQMSVHYA